ncbi:hypothetical protein CXB51_019560 [Gossypium anomalum]|uniref:Small ribosomal subunit protein uS11c n=1 Tax=Gossypium anomalum TaxID=47600 RepID=A0A8J5YBS3_9ROSI|nr:hypothetical protein CXB51_019560 [Gossypium anomalum]
MEKPIPTVGSHRNGRSSGRKSARRIPKGVIHVQASFNNTIVTVTDVRGRVISWSSVGTCGFKGTRRGAPFAAQTTIGNAIRAVVEQGMQQAEVMIKGPGLGRDATLRAICRSGILLSFVRDVTPMPHNGCRPPKKIKVSTLTQTRHWKCVESSTDSQANTISIAMRRTLLGELQGTCITRAKSEKIPHEYSTIVRFRIYNCSRHHLPPSMEVVDNTQHVANLTKPIDLCIGLQIKRNRGYGIKKPKNFHDGSYPIYVVFMPVRNANHSFILQLSPLVLVKLIKKKKEIALKYIFIDQSKLPPRIYNCLKKSNIHKLLDLLNYSREDLMKIKHFCIKDVKQILGIIEKK